MYALRTILDDNYDTVLTQSVVSLTVSASVSVSMGCRLIRSEDGVLEGFHGVLNEAHLEEVKVAQDLAEVHHGPDLPNKQ